MNALFEKLFTNRGLQSSPQQVLIKNTGNNDIKFAAADTRADAAKVKKEKTSLKEEIAGILNNLWP